MEGRLNDFSGTSIVRRKIQLPQLEVCFMAGWITIGKYHARVNLGKAWIHRKKVFPVLGAGFVAYCVGLYLIFDTYKESINK